MPMKREKGSLTIRSKCRIEEGKNGKHSIVVYRDSLSGEPYQSLKKIADLIRDKKLPEISNVHDGADRHGIDIIIELKQNAIPQVVLNKLYKHTQLQVGFGVIMLALVNGVPRVLSLKGNAALLHLPSGKTSWSVVPSTNCAKPKSAPIS